MLSRVYRHPSSQRGVLLIATIVTLVALSAMSLALVETMRRESQILNASIQQNKAETIAITGMERAIKFVSEIGDWSNVSSPLANNMPFGGGTYTVTASDASRDNITLHSQGNYQGASHSFSRALVISPDPNHPGFLRIYTSTFNTNGVWLVSIYLENARPHQAIWITHAKIVTAANAANNLKILRINRWGWVNIWIGDTAPGTLLDTLDLWIPPPYEIWGRFEFQVKFSQDVSQDGDITFEFHLADGAIYSKTVPIP